MFSYPPAYQLDTLCLGGTRGESAGIFYIVPLSSQIPGLAYSIGTGVQATGCTTCTLPPAAAVPCNTCQTAPPAPPITIPQSQWGEWGPFGQCTVSCGGGQHARQRLCNNGCSTCQCIGSAVDVQSCNTAPCPARCSTCQQPQYDPPTPAPCTTCGNPITLAPCPTCSYPTTPSPCLTYFMIPMGMQEERGGPKMSNKVIRFGTVWREDSEILESIEIFEYGK
ncbi:hypothetical protein RB195_015308 [Necator americanus]|uniref:Thrombospondin type 1 domain protein n=1 Tax=Necator americanus TaxID=51031 RepID=A0ABR1E4F9_NECAM